MVTHDEIVADLAERRQTQEWIIRTVPAEHREAVYAARGRDGRASEAPGLALLDAVRAYHSARV